MKPCPYCAELIQDQAAKCRYCGEWLDPSKRPAWSQQAKAAAAVASSAPVPAETHVLDEDDPPLEGPGATLPVGSGLPDLARRDPEPTRSWSAPAWLANAQAARVEPREEPPSDRSTLEEVALRMERIRQSAAAVRDPGDPPRAVRPAELAAERATLEVEPGVTLPAGSLRALGIEPRDGGAGRPARARTMPAAPRPAPVVHDDDLSDFDDDPPPMPRARAYGDEVLARSERPTVPDIPREQLMAEAYEATARHRGERSAIHEPHGLDVAVAPTERVRKRKAEAIDDELDPRQRRPETRSPEPELTGPSTERVRKRRARAEAHDDDLDAPPPRRPARVDDDLDAPLPRRAARVDDDLDAPPPRRAARVDDDLDAPPPRRPAAAYAEDEGFEDEDDEPPPPRAGAAAFDDDFLDDEEGEDDEGEDDEGGFEGFEGPRPAPRPLRWPLVLGGAGVIVVAAVLLFRDYLFPSEPETDEVADAADEGAPADGGQPEAKAKPPVKLEGEGQPVQPETKADTTGAGAGMVADAGQLPKPGEPSPVDADTKAALEEIRKSYDAAAGSPRKLQPVGTKLQGILAKSPNNPEALTFMAQVYLEQGKIDDSLETSNHCTAVAPTSAGCWLTIGVIQHEFKRNHESARAAYQKYLELDPDGRYAKVARNALKKLK